MSKLSQEHIPQEQRIVFHKKQLKILLVYPEHPKNTYWSFNHSLPYVNKKASMPPLGLITVAALLPKSYEVRLIDMNIEPLLDDDIRWADAVFTSTMIPQAPSVEEVIQRVNRLGVPIVAGGPHPSADPNVVKDATHIIVGEAESILAEFLADFEQGRAEHIYRAKEAPDVTTTPLPRFDLLKLDAYASMAVQYSRGCPFMCEFCDIWKLYGRRPRIKENQQFLAELQALLDLGWRDSVFIVDDNFIGNPKRVKAFLRDLIVWQEEHGYPISLYTEASLNLATDNELLTLMRDAGFTTVFLGIETPSLESLQETHKSQNLRTDLKTSVRLIQEAGLEVQGGFIVGFDNDPSDIYERQIEFIKQANIPMAMVGLLVALTGTELHKRLLNEGRMLEGASGSNTHNFTTNFVTKQPVDELAAGYKHIISMIYDRNLKHYFDRGRGLLTHLGYNPHFTREIHMQEIKALLKSLLTVFTKPYGWEYLKFLGWTLRKHPQHFPEAGRLGITGFHFQAITSGALKAHAIEEELARLEIKFASQLTQLSNTADSTDIIHTIYRQRKRTCRRIKRQIKRLEPSFRQAAEEKYALFLERLDALFATHVPLTYQQSRRGAEMWNEIQAFFMQEEENFFQRYYDLRDRASQGIGDIQRGLVSIYDARQATLRKGKQLIRTLPHEYRLLARREYKKFQKSLGEIMGRETLAAQADPT